MLSVVILWVLLFIHRHFDSTPKRHDSLFALFSVDGYKKPAPKSLRKPSGKKVGGQNGHQGTHLAVITAPDETVKHSGYF